MSACQSNAPTSSFHSRGSSPCGLATAAASSPTAIVSSHLPPLFSTLSPTPSISTWAAPGTPLPLQELFCPSITIGTELSSICSSRERLNDATAVRLRAPLGLPLLGPPIADCRSSWSAATEVT
ncbi:hypothetical protein PVAP13_9NG233200 [Panicum virgatum]|uniref:Uncharacterized protein n=1 Tax=Panicum virgatum TaxID=38727 RepID=A0A8T0MJG3_PANVG|nr:hypothetical protein PVAP13_9NG233200 [Panicum virgatum]